MLKIIQRLLFTVLPVSFLVLPYVFHVAYEDSGFYFAKESGAVEIITAILLAVAIAVGLQFFVKLLMPIRHASTPRYWKLTILWSVIFCLGCIYFLGEEISWGQHLGAWETPDAWKEINDQNETNLHNTSGWLDQVPRTVLTFGIIFGGVVYPLLQRGESRNRTGENFLIHFMPNQNCILAGTCVIALELLMIVEKATDSSLLPHDGGEIKESLIAMFLLVYIFDFSGRAFENRTAQDQSLADA